MKRILLFSGTTEGRTLAETLSRAGVPAVVCVATEYGSQVMPPLPGIVLRQGRMGQEEMEQFIGQEEFLAVADATHPFAVEVSQNIRQSAEHQGVPYLRLQRRTGRTQWMPGGPEGLGAAGKSGTQGIPGTLGEPGTPGISGRLGRQGAPGEPENEEDAGLRDLEGAVPETEGGWFADHEACAAALLHTTGPVLLTTGSKALEAYCRHPGLRERLYVRVLPSEESLAACREAGLKGRQVIAIQGPCSEEFNLALMRQFQIRHLVTKESGAAGGFPEKVSAAEKLGAALYVIGNPEQQDGLSYDQVCGKLEELTGISIRGEEGLTISLIGIGMGSRETLTAGAMKAIAEADVIFGAKRMLDCVRSWGLKETGQAVTGLTDAGLSEAGQAEIRLARTGLTETEQPKQTGRQERKEYAYYRAEEILPVLEALPAGKSWKAAVLFSGDSGFYSGCQRLYEALNLWKQKMGRYIDLKVCPGISSVSYLSAAWGMSWEDGKILSIHGKGDRFNWEPEVAEAVRNRRKVFLLVSGVGDVQAVGQVLLEHGFTGCRVLVGYQLSYPNESVRLCTPQECTEMTVEGLYLLAVLRENTEILQENVDNADNAEKAEKTPLAPDKADSAFIRGKVPMTKEEIRELAVCKLGLTEGAVVYDVGSGTGSVAVEIAARSGSIRVYAVEQKAEGVELTRKNRNQFGLSNITVIQGTAPDCFQDLPAPTHAFIGGSGGNLKEILAALREKNPAVCVVITAISLETVGELAEILREIQRENQNPAADLDLIQVQVSRAKQAGSYHLMQAENPVYLCRIRYSGKKEGR